MSKIALPSHNIPSELYKDDSIFLPEEIVEIYKNYLIKIGKYEEAKHRVKDDFGVIGGISREETIKHFTQQYANSVARIEFLILDPKNKLDLIPCDLTITLSGGNISLLDIPCGTGASTIALLATLAKLRSKSVISKLPLNVNIIAGDYSKTALEIYNEQVLKIEPFLLENGIHINFITKEWNAENEEETGNLITQWFSRSESTEEYLVLISAFSGAGKNKKKLFEDSFKHIEVRLIDKWSTILWIEPWWNPSKSFFDSIVQVIKKPWFKSNKKSSIDTRFSWFHPIRNIKIDRGSISVIQHRRIIKNYEY